MGLTVRLSVAVQHHPSRAHLLPELLGRLAPLEVEVVTDPEPDGQPNPWRCYHECLRRTPDWCTHRLVLQDDADVCDHFAESILAALEARGAVPVALFVGGLPGDACAAARQASKAGERWVRLSPWSWFPAVASVWPAATVARLLAWADEARVSPYLTRADDAVLARFLQHERIWPLATVPSLVEHPDVVPSTIGRKARAGSDPGRVACIPIGATDARTISWG